MINRAALFTAPATPTLLLGLFTLPTSHMQDRKQAQTLGGMWHFQTYEQGHAPKHFDHE